MALTAEDLQALGDFIDARVAAAVQKATTPAPVVDAPDVAATKEAAPWYFVHLADGRVVETQDSSSTVMDNLAVIGRFPKEPPMGGEVA